MSKRKEFNSEAKRLTSKEQVIIWLFRQILLNKISWKKRRTWGKPKELDLAKQGIIGKLPHKILEMPLRVLKKMTNNNKEERKEKKLLWRQWLVNIVKNYSRNYFWKSICKTVWRKRRNKRKKQQRRNDL